MRILITGAAGFIGSNFLYYWLRKHPKDKIRVIDALTFAGNIENIKPVLKKIDFIEADITDRPKVRKAMEGVDAVVHFAAESHVDRSIFAPDLFWKTNVDGTLILLEEAHKAKVPRFHHISTDEVYGELPLDSSEKFTEETPYAPRPDNLYAVSKAEADKVVMEFYKKTEMHITISNCSNNFGPYQFPEKYIPILITNLIDGYKAPVHGDGLNVRDWIHTEDHSKAIELILSKGKPGEIYLVGSENDRSNREIAEKVTTLCGKDKSWIKYVPDRHSNDRRYAIDPTKIYRELGWKPSITRENFDDGLRETISWYKKNEDWWRPLLNRKAVISDGEHNIIASISLDRTMGKMRYNYQHEDEALEIKSPRKKKESILKEKISKLSRRSEQFIKEKLDSRKWFQDTDEDVKKNLLELVKDRSTRGFVEDLANRPARVGSTKQIRLIKIAHAPKKYGIYGIAAWFEVETKDGKKGVEGVYSWAMGPKSGAKLLVLLQKNNLITDVILLKNEKFPVGAEVYDMPGGFPKENESVIHLIRRQLKEELGIDTTDGNAKLVDVISLGRIMPDAGMTNNHPFLYAVVIETKKKKFKGGNGEVVIWPIEKLNEMVNRVDDGYFLSALTRLTLSGVTNIKLGR